MNEAGPIPLADGAVHLATREVVRDQKSQRLTPIEAKLLHFLVARQGRPASREVLLRDVWQYNDKVRSRTVVSTVNRLRTKIEADPARPRHLLTVAGGYRFRGPPSPTVATDLLGREQELAALDAAHDERVALVSVIGAGGIGKTALLRTWCALRPDVHLVELQGQDQHGALATIAARLGLSGTCSGPAITQWLAAVDEVLVLDDVCPELRPLLQQWVAAGRLVISVRRPTELPDEHIVRLGPLTPDDAHALLARRLDDDDVEALVPFGDGHPLALHLIAAGARIIGVPAQVARLKDTPALDVLNRTLQVTWQCMTDAEQHQLGELSLFAGEFPLAVAEVILDAPATENLLRLVDSGLIEAMQGRFRFLQPVRDFIVERRPATHQAWRRTVDWVASQQLSVCTFNEPPLGPEQGLHLFEWCLTHDPSRLFASTKAVYGLGLQRFPYTVLIAATEKALVCSTLLQNEAHWIRFLKANLQFLSGDPEGANGLVDLERLVEHTVDPPLKAMVTNAIAGTLKIQGETDTAIDKYKQALTIAEKSGVWNAVASAQVNLCSIMIDTDPELSRAFGLQGLMTSRKHAMPLAEYRCIVVLIQWTLQYGDLKQVWGLFDAVSTLLANHDWLKVVHHHNLIGYRGMVYLYLGDHDAALEVLQEAINEAEANGAMLTVCAMRIRAAVAHRRKGSLILAEAEVMQAIEIARTSHWESAELVGRVMQFELRTLAGDGGGEAKARETMESVAHTLPISDASLMRLCWARTLLILGHRSEAEAIVSEVRSHRDSLHGHPNELDAALLETQLLCDRL